MIWRGEGVGFGPWRPVRVTDAFQFSFPTAAVHGQKSAPCRTEPLLTADGAVDPPVVRPSGHLVDPIKRSEPLRQDAPWSEGSGAGRIDVQSSEATS